MNVVDIGLSQLGNFFFFFSAYPLGHITGLYYF